MTKVYTSIGLMSGTSGDGIDASIIQSDGEDKISIIGNNYTSYSDQFKEEISNLKDLINSTNDLMHNKKIIEILEKKLTVFHYDSVKNILDKFKEDIKKIDILGFHGQTIFHSYKEKISKQIGDGNLLNKLTNIDTIFNFRENDIKNGGQGAPLTPIYHKFLLKKLNLILPTVIINIGGISNLTYLNKKEKIVSFDCGAGNFLIDKFLKVKSNYKMNYDLDGKIAFRGKVDEIILENYLNDPYYELSPPKTLDVNDLSLSMIRGLTLENTVATLSELTARTIVDSLRCLDEKPNEIIITGGGRKNKFIFERIKTLSKIKTTNIDDYSINGDFVESQAFAFLSIRSLLNKPITFPNTTGVLNPCCGGVLVKN